jgi:hypothetical protein
MLYKAWNYIGKATYNRYNIPPPDIQITGDRRGQMDQGRIKSYRLYNKTKAYKRPQAPN